MKWLQGIDCHNLMNAKFRVHVVDSFHYRYMLDAHIDYRPWFTNFLGGSICIEKRALLIMVPGTTERHPDEFGAHCCDRKSFLRYQGDDPPHRRR